MSNDIDRESLQEMFDEIRANTSWNLEGELLWGYVFTDPSEEKLIAAGEALEKQGYVVVGVFEGEEEDEHDHDHEHGEGCDHDHDHAHPHAHGDDDTPIFVLQVEEVKHHTIDSLMERNRVMSAFAKKHDLESYDGIEVGEVQSAVN
ncbi:MAG: ribonuclease E inhibitor RraB [Polyangiaceae bacterium]